jgi:hypothetical protein
VHQPSWTEMPNEIRLLMTWLIMIWRSRAILSSAVIEKSFALTETNQISEAGEQRRIGRDVVWNEKQGVEFLTSLVVDPLSWDWGLLCFEPRSELIWSCSDQTLRQRNQYIFLITISQLPSSYVPFTFDEPDVIFCSRCVVRCLEALPVLRLE